MAARAPSAGGRAPGGSRDPAPRTRPGRPGGVRNPPRPRARLRLRDVGRRLVPAPRAVPPRRWPGEGAPGVPPVADGVRPSGVPDHPRPALRGGPPRRGRAALTSAILRPLQRRGYRRVSPARAAPRPPRLGGRRRIQASAVGARCGEVGGSPGAPAARRGGRPRPSRTACARTPAPWRPRGCPLRPAPSPPPPAGPPRRPRPWALLRRPGSASRSGGPRTH